MKLAWSADHHHFGGKVCLRAMKARQPCCIDCPDDPACRVAYTLHAENSEGTFDRVRDVKQLPNSPADLLRLPGETKFLTWSGEPDNEWRPL